VQQRAHSAIPPSIPGGQPDRRAADLFTRSDTEDRTIRTNIPFDNSLEFILQKSAGVLSCSIASGDYKLEGKAS
jgi:hypothetical protein